MKKKIIFIQSTGAWWDHRYFFKQMPSLAKFADISYMVRRDKGIIEEDYEDVKFIQISNKKAKWARMTGGLNLFYELIKSQNHAIQLCNIELLPLGVFLSLFSKSKVFYDCREDHFHAMLHSKVWFPKWFRYVLGYSVKFLEFIASKTFCGFVDSDPAIYKFHNYMPKSKKMIFYNMALKKQFNSVKRSIDREFHFCVLGSMSVRTGVLDVVKAFAEIKKNNNNLKLKLIGDPFFDKVLGAQINEILDLNNLHNDIKITGRVSYDRIPYELAECKVGIIPLLNIPKFQNNIATKQFEYMASEMAVIATNLTPQKIFIKENINGLFYEPGNVGELVEKMLETVNNSNKLNTLSKNAKKFTEEDWNSEAQQEKFLKFYKLRLERKPYIERQIPPFH